MKEKVSIFWFRRDLRLEDNHGLYEALKSGLPVLPIFILDEAIISELPEDDPRVNFILDLLQGMNEKLKTNKGIIVKRGRVVEVLNGLFSEFQVSSVFTNHDYEPYARERDKEVQSLCERNGIQFLTFKDQVIFEKAEVTKDNGQPYTVFTPFKNKWLSKLEPGDYSSFHSEKFLDNLLGLQNSHSWSKSTLGIKESSIKVPSFNINSKLVGEYDEKRDIPSVKGTTHLSTHLRFGTGSIRKLVSGLLDKGPSLLSELIWREFFMQILYHFPHVVTKSFKKKYDQIQWLNDEEQFKLWCEGKTGYPMVDAGMRELNATGLMHNRVRMVTASFLCKHLLIDWRWGESYFAKKLLDFELSSNNGNWQWAAGTGCDAAPYFRVFNPEAQQKKFDPQFKYIKKWVHEFGTPQYPRPIVDHSMARKRAIETYKSGLERA